MTIGVFIFILSLAAAGGAYAWKGILSNAQTSYKQQLADRERAFNVNLIEELKQANIQIDNATRLLQNHLALSQIFDVISRLTISNVRFTQLSLSHDPASPGSPITIEMKGSGTSRSAVAFQSDVLGQLEQYGLRKVVKNPVLSNPGLEEEGTVSFDFSAEVDAAALTYAKSVSGLPPTDESLNTTVPPTPLIPAQPTP